MRHDETAEAAGDAPALEAWQLRVTVPDDSLSPVLDAGAEVVVDCSDSAPVDGSLVAVRHGGALELWLYMAGFAGIGCRLAGRPVATLGVLGGGYRCRGPVDAERLRVVGRVLEPGANGCGGGLARLDEERRRLSVLRDSLRHALRRCPVPPDELRGFADVSSLATLAERFRQQLADATFGERFVLEQRLDVIDARLALLDELIADATAAGLADALVKLETLWQLQPAELAPDDLEIRLLGSALPALRRMVADRARLGGAAAPTPSGPAPSAEPRPQPLELVASPRHRRR